MKCGKNYKVTDEELVSQIKLHDAVSFEFYNDRYENAVSTNAMVLCIPEMRQGF
jgi:hypothetical protein